jgi:hypothetical protein
MPVDFGSIGETQIPVYLVTSNHKISVDVDCFDTLTKLKEHIQLRFGIQVEKQKLTFNYKELLEDNKTLDEHGIKFNSEIHIGSQETSKL